MSPRRAEGDDLDSMTRPLTSTLTPESSSTTGESPRDSLLYKTRKAAKHPAKLSEVLWAPIASQLVGYRVVLDPMAGVGMFHYAMPPGSVLWCNELEEEWAAYCGPLTTVGDAADMVWEDGTFDAIATSPAYGNRMADRYAGDGTYRATYRISLGRLLDRRNGAGFQWTQPEYKDLHVAIWTECVRVLRPGGRFVLNISDHYRKGVLQDVSTWHVNVLCALGLVLTNVQKVPTPRMRNGANSGLRAEYEYVVTLDKPF